jgi:Family of unknown function (DUF6118)
MKDKGLMTIAAPESWRAIVVGDKIVVANRDTIEGCRKAAVKAREAVRCTIRINSPEDDQRGVKLKRALSQLWAMILLTTQNSAKTHQ